MCRDSRKKRGSNKMHSIMLSGALLLCYLSCSCTEKDLVGNSGELVQRYVSFI